MPDLNPKDSKSSGFISSKEDQQKWENPPQYAVKPFTFFTCVFLTLMALNAAHYERWFGVIVDVLLIVVNLGLSFKLYSNEWKLYRHWKNIKALDEIIGGPVLKEDGNSIIITYLMPSERLIKEISELGKKGKK